MLFCLLECDPRTLGAVFTHLAEEEQGQACDWNHMQGRQVMRVISHTAAAELSKQPEAHWRLSVVSTADMIVTCRAAFGSITGLIESISVQRTIAKGGQPMPPCPIGVFR